MRPAEACHAEGAAANSRAAETRHTEGASPDARPAETRDTEGANAPEAAATCGKAAAVTAKAAVAAKAPTVPAETSSACVGFKREKRDGEEQHRDSASAGHRPPAPGA
jgi:hypothetical protein